MCLGKDGENVTFRHEDVPRTFWKTNRIGTVKYYSKATLVLYGICMACCAITVFYNIFWKLFMELT